MEINDTYFIKKYTIKQNDLDKFDKVTLTSILDICQDGASKHADILNVGFDVFNERKLFWVLSKNRVEIIKDLDKDDEVTLKTYQSEVGFAGFNRDYYLYNSNDELCVKADSKWCVLDRTSNKIVPVKDLNASTLVGEPKAFIDKYSRIDVLKEWDFEFDYQVMFTDLDHNLHMNNTKYTIPILNYFKEKRIYYTEIDYINQSYIDDKLKYMIKKIEDNVYIVNVLNVNRDVLCLKCLVKVR